MGNSASSEGGPVFQAVRAKDIGKLQELKSQGVKPDEEVNKNGDTPLLHVVRVGPLHYSHDILKLLIEWGGKESLDRKDKWGYTPLQVALLATCRPTIKWHEVADLLIQAGADASGVRKIERWIECHECKKLVHHHRLA